VNAPRILHRPFFLVVLAVVLYLECAMMAAISGALLIELVAAKPDSYASAIALLLLALLATAWLAVVGTGALRSRPWIRGGTIVWQVLQILIAVSSFQGAFAAPGIGWALLVPAVVALLLLFTPTVIAATKRVPEVLG
jgi:hypothetical protein